LDVEHNRISIQIHRGIPRLNRDKITQVMKFRSTVLGSNTEDPWKQEKSNMKMVQNVDPR